jgi:hypothetical protein
MSALTLNAGGASVPASRPESFSSLTGRAGTLARRIRVHSQVCSDPLPWKRKLLHPLLASCTNVIHLRQQCPSLLPQFLVVLYAHARLRSEYLDRKVVFRVAETQPKTRILEPVLHAIVDGACAIPEILCIFFRGQPRIRRFQKKSVRRPLNENPHSCPPSTAFLLRANAFSKNLFTGCLHHLRELRVSVVNARLCSTHNR